MRPGNPRFFSWSNVAWGVAVLFLLCPLLSLAASENGETPAGPAGFEVTDRLPGVDLAQAITSVTGVAISPLLGVTTVGAWHYFRTPAESRGDLPWFCHPLAWGLGWSVLLLCGCKDLIGTAAPPLLKKPVDAAELFENKVSGLLVCTAFVPFVANQLTLHFGISSVPPASAGVESGGAGGGELLSPLSLAMVEGGVGLWLLLTPLLLAGFLVVWLLGHTINVLVLLSPFGFLDAGLKACRLGMLSLILVLSAIHPVLGALFCTALIAVAALLAPWTFRLSVFGAVMGGDLVTSLFHRSKPPQERIFGFLAHRNGDRFRVRCGGWLRLDGNGHVMFESRRALVGPVGRFRLALPGRLGLCRGLLFPSAFARDDSGQAVRPSVLLLPRYRRHLEGIAADFRVAEIEDSLLQRGWKGAISWVKDTAQLGRKSAGMLLPGSAGSRADEADTASP